MASIKDHVARAKLFLAARAAKEILDMLDRPGMWLSKEAQRDLRRLAQELPKETKPMYTLDGE